MKKILFLTLFLWQVLPSFAQFKVPDFDPDTYIQDFDHILTPEQNNILNQRVIEIRKKSTVEIAVVILSDLQGREIEDVALEIGRTWGVGQKGLNNGIVYIVSPQLRKSRIEVGPGLQGDIPDIEAEKIQEVQKPFFRKGDYFAGIDFVLGEINKRVDPIAKEQRRLAAIAQKESREKFWSNVADIFFYFFLPFVIISLIAISLLRRSYQKKQAEILRKKQEDERHKVCLQIRQKQEEGFNITELRKASLQVEDIIKKKKLEQTDANKQSATLSHLISSYERFSKTVNNITALSYNEVYTLLLQLQSYEAQILNSAENIRKWIKDYEFKIQYIIDAKTTLPLKRQQALDNLKNTEYSIVYMSDNLFASVMNIETPDITVYNHIKNLETIYYNIINYQELKKKREEEKAERERIRSSYSSSSYSSYSSSSSSYSSSYDSSSSFSGGSFDGGGSNSSW